MPIDNKTLIKMYGDMVTIRYFELQARDLFLTGRLRGATHMYIGEEAIAVGVCSVLNKSDYITSTHRGHGHCLAKGGDPKAMMAELLGRSTGYCKGKGGSMHIADLDLGILGANGIVGGGIGLAAGAAFAGKYRNDGRVSVCFFGDGAINQGNFYETANMAALWKIPLIYVCERNQFAEFSYSDRYFADPDLNKRVYPFNIPSVSIDGNDVMAVYEAATESVDRCRRGEGPSMIVALSYRIEGHTIGDPLDYRKNGEVDEWKSDQRDPILRFGRYLVSNNIVDEQQLKSIDEECKNNIDEAVEYGLNSPDPMVETLWDDVYV